MGGISARRFPGCHQICRQKWGVLPADLMTVTKSAGRNGGGFLPADLLTVSESAGRITWKTFYHKGNYLVDACVTNYWLVPSVHWLLLPFCHIYRWGKGSPRWAELCLSWLQFDVTSLFVSEELKVMTLCQNILAWHHRDSPP